MSDETSLTPPETTFMFFQPEDGKTRVEVRVVENDVWLSQAQIATLYQTTPQNISQHINEIFLEGELQEGATCKQYLQVQQEGSRTVRRNTKFYNLKMILAIGYRVRNNRGVQFRTWASNILAEYIVKGFAMDDERLKNPSGTGIDYFDELLERIRDIRTSEKRVYQKIKDIFKLSSDYNENAEETVEFFKIVQNKLHWAATGKTAAELIAERANPSEPNMGLTSWSGGKVRKVDVTVAKNYLDSHEIDELNRIVSMYLDFAEDQAKRKKYLFMKDWIDKLDAFLQFNDREILQNAGSISMKVAQKLAADRYEEFNEARLRRVTEDEKKEDLRAIEDRINKERKEVKK